MHTTLIHDLDIIGAIFSFISTLFYIRASHYAWPASLAAISINLVLYALSGLYADAAKEGIYLALCLFGWYWWLFGGEHRKALSISHITRSHALILSALVCMGIITTSETLIHFSHSQVPYWDAITTIISLAAEWLTCRKIMECWVLWFIVDVLYTGLYFYKGLPVHGFLLITYMIMAVVGYLTWRKMRVSQQNNNVILGVT